MGTGSITCKVTDSATNPIQGATVSVAGTSISTATDNNGVYIISSVPVGVQTIRASRARFSPAEATVTVNANQITTQDFTLTLLTGSITGKVTRSATNPIQGATVIVVDTPVSATTDNSGSYTISSVPVGVQTVRASKAGFTPQILSTTVQTNQLSIVNFELSEICPAGRPDNPCPVGEFIRPCPAARPDNPCPVGEFIRPCPAARSDNPCPVGEFIRQCPAAKPDNLFVGARPLIAIRTEEATQCHAGRPTIAPKSGQKPQIKPRGSEVD